MKVFFPPAVYLSHPDGEGREEEGWTSGREGEQSKADTHTSAGQQFTAPHQTPHVRRDKSRDGVTEGEEKRKSSAERKELCQKTKQKKKASASWGNSVSLVRLPLQRLIFCFVSNGRKYLRE